MALFLKETDQRSQLQNKIAADMQTRTKVQGGGDDPQDISKNKMLEDTQESSSKSLFWVGVVTIIVIAAVIFVIFIYEG
ncbi:MAG TPA: hypothetical protein VLA77_02810 [Candidatus Saccharimonadales bacterium]|nr:hypothetical protein [Candidatus Saccharimonadales bacterium]